MDQRIKLKILMQQVELKWLILNIFGAAHQAGILSAASRAEVADVERMKKIVPLTTCEIPFCQHVCELVFGVNVTVNNQSKATL